MNFSSFIEHLEQELGYHQIPLNPQAHDIKDILESSPLHDDLTRQLVRTIYKRNRCQRLIDPVERDKTEDVLKEIRAGIFRETRTDVDRFHFIEDFCAAVDRYFAAHEAAPGTSSPVPPVRSQAQIINLGTYRNRRRRWRA